jgi:thiol:disulfide interchange protein DsbC
MRANRTCLTVIALASALVSTSASAASEPQSVPKDLQHTLQSRFPNIRIVDVQPAPVAGLFEVFTGQSIVYTDRAGDYLFTGQLIDTRTREDISAERLDLRNTIDFASLPRDRAIKIVKGNGTRELAVFSDPDCPYCQQLEKELASMTDLTVYIYLYPIADLHPQAPARARSIWCSKDREHAWTQWMLEKKPADGKEDGCDGDPVAELVDLGRKLNVTSTPTLFFTNGRKIGGTVAAVRLEQLLKLAAESTAEKSAVVSQTDPGTATR